MQHLSSSSSPFPGCCCSSSTRERCYKCCSLLSARMPQHVVVALPNPASAAAAVLLRPTSSGLPANPTSRSPLAACCAPMSAPRCILRLQLHEPCHGKVVHQLHVFARLANCLLAAQTHRSGFRHSRVLPVAQAALSRHEEHCSLGCACAASPVGGRLPVRASQGELNGRPSQSATPHSPQQRRREAPCSRQDEPHDGR